MFLVVLAVRRSQLFILAVGCALWSCGQDARPCYVSCAILIGQANWGGGSWALPHGAWGEPRGQVGLMGAVRLV